MEASSSNSKGKQKEINGTVTAPTPMGNPPAGSANPSASFPALWNYIEPALIHIVRSPAPSSPLPNSSYKSPPIDFAYHMGIHTAVYNYFTSSRYDVSAAISGSSLMSSPPSSAGSLSSSIPPMLSYNALRTGKATPAAIAASMLPPSPPPQLSANPHGADLYSKLDSFYSESCSEILYSLPPETGENNEDESAKLVPAVLAAFYRFSAGASVVDRLLAYMNRHYVKRAVEEDRGWLRLVDVLDIVAQSLSLDDKVDLGLIDPNDAKAPQSSKMSARTNSRKSGSDKNNRNNKNGAGINGTPSTATVNGRTGGTGPREKIALALRERRLTLLSQFGYTGKGVGASGGDDDSKVSLAQAEASAEAASPLDRVVPLVSLAHRRFREEVVKPLLAIPPGPLPTVPGSGPGGKGRGKRRKGGKGGRGVKPDGGTGPPISAGSTSTSGEGIGADMSNSGTLPKSRLARAVKAFIENKEFGGDEATRKALAAELNAMLGIVGISVDHVLRRRLEKFAPSYSTVVRSVSRADTNAGSTGGTISSADEASTS